jgi:hypothetical protein
MKSKRQAIFHQYLCSKKSHPEHVEGLPLHILRTHVDDALESKAGAHGGSGNTVLASASLGDDALLPEPLGEQSLRDGVVDLVGTGMVQILPLEVNQRACSIGAPVVLRQTLREVQRALTANVVLENAVELFLRIKGAQGQIWTSIFAPPRAPCALSALSSEEIMFGIKGLFRSNYAWLL